MWFSDACIWAHWLAHWQYISEISIHSSKIFTPTYTHAWNCLNLDVHHCIIINCCFWCTCLQHFPIWRRCLYGRKCTYLLCMAPSIGLAFLCTESVHPPGTWGLSSPELFQPVSGYTFRTRRSNVLSHDSAWGVDTASGIIEGTACRSIAVGESLGAFTDRDLPFRSI